MRVAIIGCGEIVFAHMRELSFIENIKVVGVCDVQEILAQDTAELYSVDKWYTDYKKMIRETKPDVVHITIPPIYQKEVAINVIKSGCSIYMEKPFCINFDETVEVIEAAKKNNVLACAGFSYYLDNAPKRCYQFMKEGKLGEIVHIEAHYGNDLGGSFGKIFLRNADHWIHKLPGKIFQNIISHSLAQIAPFINSPLDRVTCWSIDNSNNGLFDDELRVMIASGKTTAYLTFCSSIRPIGIWVRYYGTKSTVEIDFTNHVFSVKENSELPGPIARIRNAFVEGKHLMKESLINTYGFITGKDRFFTGMGNLFEKFYLSVQNKDKEPPIPYKDVLVVAEIMDRISDHCSNN